MKKKLLIIFLCLLSVLHITAQTETTQTIDKMINVYVGMNLFSGTVMVAENGETIYYKAFGYSDIENEIKNEVDTKFNFGSIGKLFTGVTILKLMQDGKLNLDDNIGMYIDYFPEEFSNKITIRHLLMHKAGLGDYLNNPKFRENIDNFKTLEDLMDMIKDEPILFEPGTNERYSNSGYATLGAVIVSVTKKSFFNAVEEIVLKPLGMNETYYSKVDQVRYSIIKYERTIEGEIVKTSFRDWPSPAGGEYSTTSDLVKFIQGVLYSNKVLTDDSKALFLNRFDPENNKPLGEIMQDERFVPMWAGGAPGVNGMICQFLKRNITITVLSNYSPPAAMEIAGQIKQIIETGNYSSPQIPLEEKIYRMYKKEGAEYIMTNFETLVLEYRFRGPKDGILNQIGYQLLGGRKVDDAIAIFKINTELFPEVANTYDSLAEAYLLSGNMPGAIENYKKILKLDPENPAVIQKLKELGSE